MTSATQVKSHTVHVDILMDVMRILFNNELAFQIEGINEDENTFLIKTSTNGKLIRHKKALENIKSLVADYAYYRHGSDSGRLDNILGEDEE